MKPHGGVTASRGELTVGDGSRLAADVIAGDRRALARAITLVEDGDPQVDAVLPPLYAHTGGAHLIGVTGAPGTGKSTLVNQLALRLRRRGQTVGIVAVDPTSPFSGGAILGDRIRMRDLAGDAGIFIRSMATRGSLGGLARATSDVTTVLDGAGFDVVIIETVGAGQAEVDIARLAHTVIVVEAPGLGDDVQAIKAGILEVADVLVVNKSDDPRAGNAIRALRAMLDLVNGSSTVVRQFDAHHSPLARLAAGVEAGADAVDGWEVPIALTNAVTGEGVDEVIRRIDAHRAHLLGSGELERRQRARALAELDVWLRDALLADLLRRVPPEQIAQLVERIVARDLMPRQAALALIESQAAAHHESPSGRERGD